MLLFGDLGAGFRNPLCASHRFLSGRGGSGHTVPSSNLNPQISLLDGDLQGDSNDSSHVVRMLLYVDEGRLPPTSDSAHSRLLANRSSEVRSHDVNDKLPRRLGDVTRAEVPGVLGLGPGD